MRIPRSHRIRRTLWRVLAILLTFLLADRSGLPVGVAAEPPSSPTFEADVLPILNAHCLQCHGGVHQRGGLDLRSHESAVKGSETGPVVVAGKPDESLLWKKLSTDAMPKTDNKVSASNKQRIRAWILAGAPGIARPTAGEGKPLRSALKPAEVARRIDRELAARLAREPAKSRPSLSPLADDAEFLRRVSLDIAGKPPTGAAAEMFLGDDNLRKREALVDRLLSESDYGMHFAERWNNLFYLTTVNQRPPNPAPFIGWLAKNFHEGTPWNTIVHDILTASGPISESPQGQFFYFNGDMNGQFTPKILVGNIGQVFLGVQIQCAECHDHPFSNWKQTDFWATAAFFGNVQKMEKVENNNTPGVIERHMQLRKGKIEPPPKEIAVSIPNDGEARNGGKKVKAALLDGRAFEADTAVSHRPPFAKWLTAHDNPQFARSTVNRLWAHFFAIGFVNPLNDFGDHNAVSLPELLEFLAEELVASHFDLKHLIRGITLSEAYQRSSRVAGGNDAREAEGLFVRMMPKVLTPEQLHDALCVALELSDLTPPPDPKNPPKKPNPKAPPPPSPRSVFLSFLRGPGEADEPTELKLGVPHALRLMNQSNFNTGGALVERLMADGGATENVLNGIFLNVLSRRPTAEERSSFGAFVAKQSEPVEGYRRIVWVLINSSEFGLNH